MTVSGVRAETRIKSLILINTISLIIRSKLKMIMLL